jgi:hypothetical protein
MLFGLGWVLFFHFLLQGADEIKELFLLHER